MLGKTKVKFGTIVATVILTVALMSVVPVPKAEAITETTGTPSQTLLSAPSPTCLVSWNQSSYTVTNGSTFQVKILITNVNYLASGQWDVFYNRSILNVQGRPTSGLVNDVYDRTYQGDPAEGCGWVPVYISSAGIDIGYGNATTNSGCLRLLADCSWAQNYPDACAGGGGTGPVGDGYLTTITFKGVSPGTCDIAFGAYPGTTRFKTQMNQIVDWAVYQDYSYPGSDVLVWGANASVTVTGSDEPTPTPTVSPTVSPTMSPTPTATSTVVEPTATPTATSTGVWPTATPDDIVPTSIPTTTPIVVEATPTPSVTATIVEPTSTPTSTDGNDKDKGSKTPVHVSWWVLGGIIAMALGLCIVIYLMAKRTVRRKWSS